MSPEVLRYLGRAVQLAASEAASRIGAAAPADRVKVAARCMLAILAELEDVTILYREVNGLGNSIAHGDESAVMLVATHEAAHELREWQRDRMLRVKAEDEAAGRPNSLVGFFDRPKSRT